MAYTPHGTPDPPQWDSSKNPTQFLADYDFWCTASGLYDVNVSAAKFAFCFMNQPTLREAVQDLYHNTATWTQMKQLCIDLLRECCDHSDGDYDSALADFKSPNTYQKYNEAITLYSRRWQKHYNIFAKARQTHGLAAWNEREKLINFRDRLVSEMQTLLFKKKGSVNTIADAIAIIREREQFNRDNKRARGARAVQQEDPSAVPLAQQDSFAIPSGDGKTGNGRRGSMAQASMSVYPPNGFPLAPARAGIHGAPDGQIESDAKVRTKWWQSAQESHNQALQTALQSRDSKLQEYGKRVERLEAKITALTQREQKEMKEKKDAENPAALNRAVQNDQHFPFPSPLVLNRTVANMPHSHLPFPPEMVPNEFKIYVAQTEWGQECLWCKCTDHNTQSCPHKCSRCAGPHAVYDCKIPYTAFRCTNCGITGHCMDSCIWRKIGSMKDTSKYGAQPSQSGQPRPFQQPSQNPHGHSPYGGRNAQSNNTAPNGAARGGFNQNFQQQSPYSNYGNSSQGQSNNSNSNGSGRSGGHGGSNRKRSRHQLNAAEGESPVRGGNFQQGVMNKKLKEHTQSLVAQMKEITKAQTEEYRKEVD